MTKRTEWIGLAAIIAVGVWLRFAYFHLLEFQGDEAFAANLALDALKTGKLPLAGLMSSVGVTNPPLFAYLLIPMFAISANPAFVSGCIAVLGLAAVVITWHIGRKYYSPLTGLVAGLFFAVSPWAVVYSRKIWAQDFVPFFATATMWAVHSLVLGKKPKTVFWCLLLPLCVIQIHFSGVALLGAVVVIIAWLRPKIDWRYAAGGVVAALLLMGPYFYLQQQNKWVDFKQAMNQVGGGQQWEKLGGVTTHPINGYRLPSKQNVSYTLAIMNGGRIEDVLGIGTARELDRAQIWERRTNGDYFTGQLTLGEWPLTLQQVAFVVALVWLGIIAVKGTHGFKVETGAPQAGWILIAWVVVQLGVYTVAGLWTYLTYFAVFFPVHYLVCGAAARRFKPAVAIGVAVALAVGNIVFMFDFYRFVDKYGGAQGTFGSALGHKQVAARYLAEQGGDKLRADSEAHLAGKPNTVNPLVIQLTHEGRAELPQLEWPFLIGQAAGQSRGAPTLGTNTMIVMVDGNREAFPPELWKQLTQNPSTNFGPIKLFIVKR